MSETTVESATATADETNTEPAETNEHPLVAWGLTSQQIEVLLRPLDPARVKQDNNGHSHLQQWDVRRTLNRIFGITGWDDICTTEIVSVSEKTTPSRYQNQPDRTVYTVVAKSNCRLVIKDQHGNVLKTIQAGAAGSLVNQPSLGDAVDNSIKIAESGALKRCAADLGDQFGLSLYNDGALEVVTGTIVDTPKVQAATPQQAAPDQAPAQQGFPPMPEPQYQVPQQQAAPAQQPRPTGPPPAPDDNAEALKKAIKIVRNNNALTNVARRIATAHMHRLISDGERDELLELGQARRLELNAPQPA